MVRYEAGIIREFTTARAQLYYRVSSEGGVGSWLTAVPPRSSAFARQALSLPSANIAQIIQEVMIPAGVRLRRSRAASLPRHGIFPATRGGAEQFEILSPMKTSWFGEGRRLQ